MSVNEGAYRPEANYPGTGSTVPWTWDAVTTWPTTVTTGSVMLWPSSCGVNVHVWACEHVTMCKCGEATRVVPAKPRCPACGA